MRLFVRPPRRPSRSARDIARMLSARLILRNNSRYRYRPGDRIINWGNPLPIEAPWLAVYNDPDAVGLAIDKLSTWEVLREHDVPTVEWSEDPADARDWLLNDQRVITRALTRASQGLGCVVYSYHGTDHTLNYDRFIHAQQTPVYVKVFGRNPKHVTEYRVAVCDGQVIDYAQKKRRRDYEGRINPYIRNHEQGWVFCREEIALPPELAGSAVEAVEALRLDFGSVDCALHRSGHTCVYEVNTAPGFEGTTGVRWRDALLQLINR